MRKPGPQTLTVSLQRDEHEELERLAAERNTDATHLVLLQLGPLRKLLRSRINARLGSPTPTADD